MSIEKYFTTPVSAIKRIPTNHFMDDWRIDSNLVKDNYNVAILGIEEGINSMENKGCVQAPNHIREQLYALQYHFDKLRICDLGNIRIGNTVRDTYAAVEDIVNQLTEQDVICIILGGSQDFTIPVFNALKVQQPKLNLAIIDSKIDLGGDENDFNASSFLTKIICDESLGKLDMVAYQSYFVPDYQLNLLKQYDQYPVRLGVLRNDISLIEPSLRDADIVSFDMSVIRQPDSPAYCFANPNGLKAEEACQLGLYAGYSDRIKAFGIFELNPDFDFNEQSAALAAQVVWHFLEGLQNRQSDYPKTDLRSYQQFIVQLELLDDNIVFFHNPVNKRWWIEIPDSSGKKVVYACIAQEYEEAKAGRIPDSWVRYFKK
jgi:arginase family enzyme